MADTKFVTSDGLSKLNHTVGSKGMISKKFLVLTSDSNSADFVCERVDYEGQMIKVRGFLTMDLKNLTDYQKLQKISELEPLEILDIAIPIANLQYVVVLKK